MRQLNPQKMAEPQVGGLITGGPVCWVSGGRRLIVGFGNALCAYIFEEDGKPRATSSFQGHESRIVAVVSIGALRVASASSDGTVRVWGVEDGSLLRTIDFGHPLLDMVAVSHGRVVVTSATEVSLLTLQRESLLVSEKIHLLSGLPSTSRRRVAASADATVIATVGDAFLTIAFTVGEVVTTVKIGHKLSFTAVAVSMDGSLLAAGTSKGSIMVYRDVNMLRMQGGGVHILQQDAVAYSKLHWHSFNVLSLCFSELGNILYSGGCEGVLVVWKMTRTDFGKRNFRPRLSGAIWGISPSPSASRVALTHADNSVRFIDTQTLGITATLRGISTAHLRNLSPWDIPRGSRAASKILRLTAEPGSSGCVIVSGLSNSVQLYDLSRGAHVADLQLIPRNTVFRGKEDDVSELSPDALSVRHVAVSMDKKFMVSVTRDVHPLTESNICTSLMYMETLKFWNYNGGNGRTNLISRVDEPHGAVGETTAVTFHPSLPVLATASSCGTFKLWRAVLVEGSPNKAVWRCERTESYRESPCTSLSFSSDGSILAVGCQSSITLWSFEDISEDLGLDKLESENLISSKSAGSLKLSYLHALVHPPSEESIAHVSFVADNSPLLLATTCHGLYVWDVLERRIWWSSRVVNRPECTVVDTTSGRFAVVVKMPSNHRAFGSRNEDTSLKTMKPIWSKKEDRKSSRRGKSAKSKRRRRSDLGPRNGSMANNAAEADPESEAEHELYPRDMQMDTAVALFNASSAVPLCVKRLPAGSDVSGITFLPARRTAKSRNKTVICFDTNMEIIRMSPAPEDGVMSSLTQNDEGINEAPKSFEEKTILGDLLGSSWRNVPGDKSVDTSAEKTSPMHVASTKAELVPIRDVLGKFLHGSTGAQPPVSTFAIPLLRELVNVVHSSANGAPGEDDALDLAVNGDAEDDSDGREEAEVPVIKSRKSADAEVMNLSAMADFLKSIISTSTS